MKGADTSDGQAWATVEYLNPFASDAALRHSNATDWDDGKVVNAARQAPVDRTTRQIHLQFREKILSDKHSCIGAKAAFRRGSYRLGVYGAIAQREVTEGLCYDLDEYFRFRDSERARFRDQYVTFAAIFTHDTSSSERECHDSLWRQLQLIHHADRRHYGWDPRVESDVKSQEFSYSLGGCAFFIVGMNRYSSRISRRFDESALVFNPGPQFELLRTLGKHDSVKAAIRRNEFRLQGSINPTLADFGEGNVALTYSGLNVRDISACPFRFRPSLEIE